MVNYIKESYEELKNHVTWPTLAQAQKEMVIVVVFSVLFSLLIWGMDSFFERLMAWYFNFMK
ncbi:Preprotein translocase, SecE subunit [Capnocytophaga canis]|uniref:Preprotein translocase, SecE subunit n=1 Tax=Capnocytophaga canis TaxID=1848903 RepID=A0A0B7HXS0_9FLAO|nr:preprotein translocase subunit SecE [Capnocytophaga canis]CEN44175.1 Preprotein translocase, SecE subunit [Capnocytophaga canis]CEN48303.1 Preprotein translocase, SecE subunit [Capnocytophaga canis]